MAQEIIVSYKAEVDDLTNKLKIVIDRMDKLEQETKQVDKALEGVSEESKKAGANLGKVGDNASKSTQKVKQFTDQSKKELSSLNKTVQSVGKSIALGIAAAFSVRAIINFAQQSVDAFSKFETIQKSFEVFLGSAERAAKVLAELDQFSIKTPFTPEEVQNASRALLAFGIEADNLIPTLTRLGNLSAGTGKDLNELAVIFGKARTQGVLFAEDINQITEAGIPIIQEFAKQFNVSESAVKKLGSQGKISFKNLEDGFKSLTEEGGKFAGLIESLSSTTAGQLSTIEGEIIAIQREIGEKLAPTIVAARRAFVQLFKDVIDYGKLAYAAATGGLVGFQEALAGLEAERAKTRQKLADDLKYQTQLESINFIKEFNNLTTLEALQRKITEEVESQSAIDRRIGELKKDFTEENRQAVIGLIKQRELSTETLGILALMVKEENKRLATQSTLITETEKLSDKRIAGSAKEIELVKSLGAEYQDLLKIFGDIDKTALRELSIEAKVEDEASIKRKVKVLEGIIKENKFDIPVTIEPTPDKPFEDVRDQFNRLKAELQDRGINTVINIDEPSVEELKEAIAKLALKLKEDLTIPVKLEVPDDKKVTTMFDGLSEDVENENEKILQASVDLVNSLNGLYDQLAQNRINAIQSQTDAELAAIDEQDKAVDTQLKKRRISEKEAEEQHAKLLKERTETEKKAAAKIRDIKRKQAILDKAAAIFDIILSTAKNVASAKNPVLKALYAAAGIAQIAIVAAQPIPYKKGSKKTKEGLARVGEEGEEIVFMPGGSKVLPAGKTRTYGDVLDKMFDGTFDKHYIEKDISTRLVAQQQKHEQTKQKSFANNLSESIVMNSQFNTDPITKQLRKGQHITNVDELADAITKRISLSPYRR